MPGRRHSGPTAPPSSQTVAARAVALDRATNRLADKDTPYNDIVFQTFAPAVSGNGPFAPTEYSDRVGIARPWEVLPLTVLPTYIPPSATPTLTPDPDAPP